ncbi:MAG: type II CAAX endopeptidase family protein [Paludibacteraceae bacterium]|nr:type II CAAX endopeptidase family protein [Paludibacteraceae bacterium]
MLLIKGAFAKEPFWIKIFLFFFLSVFGLLIGGLLCYVLFQKSQGIDALRWSQFIISLASFCLPAFISALIFQRSLLTFLRADKYPSFIFIFLAIFAMILFQPVINLISSWNQQLQLPAFMSGLYKAMQSMEASANDLTRQFLAQQKTKDLFVNIFFLALIPAITEELFFRGTLLRLLEEKMSVNWSIWIVAIIFSTYHMQFFGFVPRILLGALLGYIVVWSHSLYLGMFAHFINNAGFILFSYLSANHYIAFDVETLGVSCNQWWITVSTFLVASLLIFFMYKEFKSGKGQSNPS